MRKSTSSFPVWARSAALAATAIVAALLAGCTSSPTAPTTPSGTTTPGQPLPPSPPSVATTPREYRKDAARHLYRHNANRIFKGRLPPQLYAIGVLDVSLDSRGRVLNLHWTRAPRHAPEVMQEIERTVYEAAPYPLPTRLGKVVYTDVWLWDKSGQFQLDTLTEGQL